MNKGQKRGKKTSKGVRKRLKNITKKGQIGLVVGYSQDMTFLICYPKVNKTLYVKGLFKSN